ncbi:MAG TPA: M42 family metallopeptidase [Bacillota bacterium]
MPAETIELFRRLSEAPGPSGQEDEVRKIIREQLAGMADDVSVDTLGNLVAHRKGRGLRVMVAAHMDEIALMVSAVEKEGLLRFRKVGGIDDRVLLTKAVLVGPRRLPGVIGGKPIHLQEPRERERVIDADHLFIDIGAKSREEAERLAKVGDYAVFTTAFEPFGDGLAKGKALDDRVGCLALLEGLGALRGQRLKIDLFGAFTVQEELGLRGATVTAYDIAPDIGLVLEGTVCSDTPGTDPEGQATVIGKGPALSVMDAGTIADRRLVQFLRSTAEAAGIPYQFRRAISGGNDAARIHLAREGAPAASISVPCRYIHSPVSVCSLDDLQNTVRLLTTALKKIAEGGLKL